MNHFIVLSFIFDLFFQVFNWMSVHSNKVSPKIDLSILQGSILYIFNILVER